MSTPEEQFKKELIAKYGEAIFDTFWEKLEKMSFAATTDDSKFDYLKTATVRTRIGGFEKVNDDSLLLSDQWLFVKDGTIDDYHKTLDNIDTEKSLSFCMNCKPECSPLQGSSKNPTKYNQTQNEKKKFVRIIVERKIILVKIFLMIS